MYRRIHINTYNIHIHTYMCVYIPYLRPVQWLRICPPVSQESTADCTTALSLGMMHTGLPRDSTCAVQNRRHLGRTIVLSTSTLGIVWDGFGLFSTTAPNLRLQVDPGSFHLRAPGTYSLPSNLTILGLEVNCHRVATGSHTGNLLSVSTQLQAIHGSSTSRCRSRNDCAKIAI